MSGLSVSQMGEDINVGTSGLAEGNTGGVSWKAGSVGKLLAERHHSLPLSPSWTGSKTSKAKLLSVCAHIYIQR